MSENLQTALTVLAVGMTTVFLILSLVVLTGKVLINIVNRFVPVAEIATSRRAKTALSKKDDKKENEKIAAIVAAVEAMTGGQGKIISIEKLAK